MPVAEEEEINLEMVLLEEEHLVVLEEEVRVVEMLQHHLLEIMELII
jgi:hypothetical protein